MRLPWLSVLVLGLGGCGFTPDLSRFEPCDQAGGCPSGFLCLAQEQRCVPECGETCTAGTDAGFDAGRVDAGLSDAGTDAGVDAGAALALSSGALPPAIETKPYAHTFQPTGGQGGYTFSMDGSVPGFLLSVGGQLSTAAAPDAGTFPFSITVQDGALPTRGAVTADFSLQVRPLLRVASSLLLEGRQTQAYSDQLSATGGQPPYRWVVDGGTPPAGVVVTPDGGLQGTPSESGVVSFGVSVIDSATPPQQDSRTVTVENKLVDLVLAIANDSMADGRVGTPYSQLLKAWAGNQSGITWSISTGSSSLPPGLALTNSSSVWTISGTPTVAGTFPFTVRCVDGVTTQLQPLSIRVY